MNDFQAKREEKAARFRELAEKQENISTGRHFAARQQLEMIPPVNQFWSGIIPKNGTAKTSSASISTLPRQSSTTIQQNIIADVLRPWNPTGPSLTTTLTPWKSWLIR
jgi:hypothetical protein